MTLTAATTSERHAAEAIEVIPTGRALGAEVRGVDLGMFGDAAVARLIQAWHQHSVMLIRNQRVSDGGLLPLAAGLGNLDGGRFRKPGRGSVRACREFSFFRS